MTTDLKLDVTPLRLERAYEAVARTMQDRIIGGAWSLGSALPGEFALAEAFGVNRSTVREALRVLEQEGLLRRSPGGKKLIIGAPSRSQVASRMSAALLLGEATFLELWEVMLLTEPAAARAAAVQADAHDLVEMDLALAQSRDALGDPRRLARRDMDFLDLIARASKNRVLQLSRAPFGELFHAAFLPVLERPASRRRMLEAHVAIVAAVRAGEASEAESWMRRHVEDFRRGYEAAGLDVHGRLRAAAPPRR